MATLRMDNVAIVVTDLDEAVAFFEEVGLELEGRMVVEGDVPGQTVGLPDVRCEIAMMRPPDGHGGIELTTYLNPPAHAAAPPAPNTIGLHRVMFAVDDMDDTIDRLERRGASKVGELANYEDVYKLCYLRGPDGIIVALAEKTG